MENDHLADAILFIESALQNIRDGYPVSEHELQRAVEEIKAAQNKAASLTTAKHSEGG